jgi:hypothetical protein
MKSAVYLHLFQFVFELLISLLQILNFSVQDVIFSPYIKHNLAALVPDNIIEILSSLIGLRFGKTFFILES